MEPCLWISALVFQIKAQNLQKVHRLHTFRLVICKLMRIWTQIQLTNLMRIRILPFSLMRIRIHNTLILSTKLRSMGQYGEPRFWIAALSCRRRQPDHLRRRGTRHLRKTAVDRAASILLLPVFRIHDILAWIRTRGSMPLSNADPDPSIFITDLQDANKKVIFSKKVFLYITFLRYLYIIYKDKKSKKMSQKSRNQVFLTIFA